MSGWLNLLGLCQSDYSSFVFLWGGSSDRLERWPVKPEVAGSIPVHPAITTSEIFSREFFLFLVSLYLMVKYKVLIIATIVLSCVSLTSCASYQKYPSEWADLILPQGEECPDISGTYVNSGETANGRSTHLSALFDFGETPSTVKQIQITQSDNDKLEISAWQERKLVSRKIYSKRNGEYGCSSKGIEIPIGKTERAAGAEGEGVTLYLVKSTDGALVIEKKSSAGGYSLLYIPMVGSSYEWYRFKPMGVIEP
jgi:hypothetical protein